MNDPSLWLSAGAFAISLVSLYFSIRKQVFDEETATADQSAILISRLGEAKVLTLKYRDVLPKLRERCLQCGKVPSETFDLYEKSMALIDRALDLDMQDMCQSKNISYKNLQLKQGHLDCQASVLSYLTQKMDEMVDHCDGGKKGETNHGGDGNMPVPQG